MKTRWQEMAGILVTILGLLAVPFFVFRYEASRLRKGIRVVRLTGVKNDGVWTERRVDGLNYWRETFPPATIELREGEEILLQLRSSDVTHGFYAPELGVGPIEVEPGHVEEVRLKAEHAGEYQYYCSTVCGVCHHFMRGRIVVQPRSGVRYAKSTGGGPAMPGCSMHQFPLPPPGGSLVERGNALFHRMGCIMCHGEGGRGGVPNFNYAKQTVPDLATLADRLGIYDRGDAEKAIRLLSEGQDLASLEDNPPFERYSRFLAQYQNVRRVIRNGSKALANDESAPTPPLNMPSWEQYLSDRDIDALIAWALSRYPWEEEAGA